MNAKTYSGEFSDIIRTILDVWPTTETLCTREPLTVDPKRSFTFHGTSEKISVRPSFVSKIGYCPPPFPKNIKNTSNSRFFTFVANTKENITYTRIYHIIYKYCNDAFS